MITVHTNPGPWRTRFAILPTDVGTDRDGNHVSIWFGLYERRRLDRYGWDMEYRPINRPEVTPKRVTQGEGNAMGPG